MISLIYLMAGKGNRMALGYNKAFYEYKPNAFIYEIALAKFLKLDQISEIFIVTDGDHLPFLREKYIKIAKIKVIEGGKRRQDSVQNALHFIQEEFVLIHDAARCFLSERDLERMLEMDNYDALYAAKLSINTIRRQIGNNFETLDRNQIYLVETPQLFKKKPLLKCIEKMDFSKEYTDEISLFENSDYKVIPFITRDLNRKLTSKEDLDYFKFLQERGEEHD